MTLQILSSPKNVAGQSWVLVERPIDGKDASFADGLCSKAYYNKKA